MTLETVTIVGLVILIILSIFMIRDKNNLFDKIDSLNTDIDELTMQLSNKNTKIGNLEKLIDFKDKTISNLSIELGDKIDMLVLKDKDIEELNNKIDLLEGELNRANNNYEYNKEQNRLHQIKIKVLKKELAEYKIKKQHLTMK